MDDICPGTKPVTQRIGAAGITRLADGIDVLAFPKRISQPALH
jgi:hypothetical protein